MKPYCPVCKKRVEPVSSGMGNREGLFYLYYCSVEKGDDIIIVVCSECGTAFHPTISERLAPKCRSCGATYDEDPDWRSKMDLLTAVKTAGLCDKCRKEGK